MTAGMKSSEFWMTIIGALLLAFKQHVLPDLPNESIYAVMAYAVSRGLAKMNQG